MKTIVTSKRSTNCTCTRRFSFGRIMMIACLFIIGMRTINSYGQSPCIPPQSVYNIIGLYISNVNTTGGLTNFTNTTGAEAASYGNYSSTKIASQSQGLPLTIFATNGGSGMDYNVYVDYNDNGVFTDPGELVLQMGNSTPGTISGSFTIPGTAPPGTHRMRIRAEYFGADYPTGPCTPLQYGETEDYGLTVTVPCTPPTTQATIGSYTNNTTGDSITVNWTRGNGTAGVLVVGRLTSSALTDPSSGTSYTANAIFGTGAQIGSGNFVVYNGTGTSVTVSGLISLTGYSFTCYEYNATETCYKTPGSALAIIAGLYCRPPQSVNYNCCGRYISNVNTTAGISNFTNTTGAETASYGNYSSTKIASQAQGSPINIFATHPSSGMRYNVYVDYNDNGVFTDPGELVLQMGNTTGGTVFGSFTIPDNAALGTHRMRVRAEESSYGYPIGPCTQLQIGETEDYGLTVTAPTGDYCIPAVSGLYNLGLYISNVTTTAGISNFTNTTGIEPSSYGNYSSTKIASQAQNSPITISATSPTTGMFYNVYIDYNDNGIFADPGELVLQMGKTTTGTITGSFSIPADAPPGTHRMRIRGEYYGIGYPTGPCTRLEYGETEDYGLTVTAGCTPPITQATIGNYTNNSFNTSSITVNWARGNGNNVLVVGRPTSSALTDPSSGASYTANTIFGSGSQIGTGNFVVYNGTGTSVTVSGLSSGTSYTFTCYEYDNTGICYKNPGSALAVVPGFYCIPPPSAWDNGKYISNVSTTGGITNFTNTTGVETASYGNYSSTKSASQAQGLPITIFATSTVSGTDYNVYVDYNDNGVFTDPGELVLQMATASAGTVSGSFTIQDNAPLGTHRMRVRSESYGTGYPAGPCTQLQYGETEDYALTVTTNCTSPPTATITAGGPTTFCQGESVMLTSSSGASYLWSTGATTQSITVSSAGNYTVNVTNANGCSATSAVTTVTVNQPETWYLDADNDGHYVSSQLSCGNPGVGYNQTATVLGDCDDNDNTQWQSATLYIDNDGDGYDNGTASVCYGAAIPAGYSATTSGTDCNDNDASVLTEQTWYLDADNNGHYVSSQLSCGSSGAGYNQTATVAGDCDDNDNTKWQSALLYADADGDSYTVGNATSICYGATIPAGYSATSLGNDCNDANASVHATQTWYLDADNDGHYVSSQSSCGSPGAGYNTTATQSGDCNDNDATKWQSPLLYVDADVDGYTVGNATSVCYGATIPAGYSATTLGADCDDNNPSIHNTVSAGITNNTGITVLTSAVTSISLTATGGGTYSWSNGSSVVSTIANLTVTSPATYTVTVTGANGCNATKSIAITQATTGISAALSAGTISCNGSTTLLIAAAMGGKVPYKYSLNGGSYKSINIFTVKAGVYTVAVKDSEGAAATAAITISQPAKISFSTSVTNVDCDGGSDGKITVLATGGTPPYSYKFGSGSYQYSNIFSGLKSGSCTITVKDANGCTSSLKVSVSQPGKLSVSASSKTSASGCTSSDGKVTVTAKGGSAPYSYKKDNESYQSGSTFTGLAAGTYTITIKDAKGCTATVNATIGYKGKCSASSSFADIPAPDGKVAASASSVLEAKVLPNPSETEFTLLLKSNSRETVEIRVLDMYGKTVHRARGAVNDTYRFGSRFVVGVYVARMLQGNHVKTIKVVKG